MNPYPQDRSVLLLDNASVHHSQEVMELCVDHGVVLEFLPPYSPEFAPVEMIFYNIKSWLRRHRDWIDSLGAGGVGFRVLHRAIAEVVTPELCDSLFDHVDLF
jgi:transposase